MNDIPAFPNAIDNEGGMTLRDYFAAKALVALPQPLIYTGSDETDLSLANYARKAFLIADAMMAERDRK